MSKEVVSLFFQASHDNDVETAMSCFAEDGIWVDPTGKVYERNEIKEYLVQQIGVLEDFHSQGVSVNYFDMVEAPDGRVYIGASVKAADGTEIRRFLDVFEMRDGKIAVKDVFGKQ
ncbi:nuclear transport factor 2 family protein [Streptomyces sp. NBRC 109706]|uniref:nuclear transport factor 2 family protein n=1 Tax=Streptomyces sp. NBRC 109706 TaxID=1550035 RepID=UPI000782E731|nr:nuclear transport factor 2 family protein [Streptomyces sp. NBRC 109706]